MPTKQEIKAWLKAIGKNRDWLADQCNVKKVTIDKWFTEQGKIPVEKLLKIQQLMTDSSPGEAVQHGDIFEITPSGIKALAIVWSEEDWNRLVRSATLRGMTPEEYAKRAIFNTLDD